MPKKKLPPQIEEISPTAYKSRKYRIKILADMRPPYGKSTFFDTHSREPRYPLDEIWAALRKAKKKTKKYGIDLIFGNEEQQLWNQMLKVLLIAFGFCLIFLMDWDGDGTPDIIQALRHLVTPSFGQVQKRNKAATPDFIEKSFGLEDDAIEKSLGLPEHSVEQFLGARPSETSTTYGNEH